MVIGLLSLEIHFPYSQSLKDKRKELNSLKDRIRQKYNVALAELDYQDTWQRTKLGIVTLNSRPAVVENILAKILRDVENHVNGDVLKADILFY
ncbi:MAG: DUF503 domain-containing protein [Candidatus Aminicenantes bacterium]|jgi:uncharacterized protein YlxP (DUF503 family)|nr:DUF503 domain-containing protein [Candidatus Aminicenantes bacterium]